MAMLRTILMSVLYVVYPKKAQAMAPPAACHPNNDLSFTKDTIVM
jgi:hypothetical protein